MSRRGGYGGGMHRSDRNWNQKNQNKGSHYSEGSYSNDFEERERKSNVIRRVSFKPSRALGRGGGIKSEALRSRLEDDEEMFEFSSNRGGFRGNKRDRRKGSPIPNRKKRLQQSTSGWYLVTIPFGSKYDKDVIIRNLLTAISPDIFIPHYWKQEKDCVSFFVDDFAIAEKLYYADKKIQMADGFKMFVRVRASLPNIQLDDNLKERMKLAMVKRYSAATKALDLSKFYADQDLKDIFCPLFRPTIMLAAIDIIATNIPDLEALNLNDNKIHLLDHYKVVHEKLPNMKILYLANNRIQSAGSLQALKNIPLVELNLDGNPFKDRYKTTGMYTRYSLKMFQLLYLDNG